MGAVLQKLLDSLYSKQLEVVIVGLENSGKSTLLSVLASGAAQETVPTVGMDVKLVKRGGLQMKCWDIGGQAQYRQEWGRYTRGCDVVIFVLDTSARDRVATARQELHRLLEDSGLATTPILVCANKVGRETCGAGTIWSGTCARGACARGECARGACARGACALDAYAGALETNTPALSRRTGRVMHLDSHASTPPPPPSPPIPPFGAHFTFLF